VIIAQAPNQEGRALLDRRTPIHFGVGFGAGYLGLSPHIALVLLIGVRVARVAIEQGMHQALFRRRAGESNANELIDLGVEVLGLELGSALRRYQLQSNP